VIDFTLKESTPQGWLVAVMADFDAFLLDHASCEKKASGMAMSMISHYPDKPDLITDMLSLAVEELSHFRDVMRLILERNLQPAADRKDDYVNRLHKVMDQGKEVYLLDRLLVASIVEARGAERFGLIADALIEPRLKNFYQVISTSEARHYRVFLTLAERYFPAPRINARLDELLDTEAEIIRTLPLQAALH
jgi:tRNA-(ms[2]io[6]A)-hydroxylase